MVLVFVGAYYASRILAQHYQGSAAGGNIKILERSTVGPNSYLLLVQVGDEIKLLGVTQKEITCLADVDKNSIQPPTSKQLPTMDFKAVLRSLREKQEGSDDAAKPKP